MVLDELLKNPTVAGAAGLMLTGAMLYLLREVPRQIIDLLYWSMTVRLSVGGDDEVFDWVNEWLSEHRYSKKARTLKLSTGRQATGGWALAPGYGKHVFWDAGLVIVERSVNEKAGGAYSIRPRERITITILGRSQLRVRAMIKRADDLRVSQEAVGVRVWTAGFWLSMPSKPKRPLDSVFLPSSQKQEIIEDVSWFFESRLWYADRGIPYRRGHLFFGPPGTGKTSLVMAIASRFNRPIYILNLTTIQNDNELLNAFSLAGQNSIILIEDVDATSASRARDKTPKADPSVPPPQDQTGVSLSGLLNAIDGVAAPEGRLLCLTTNHLEKLDPALVRSARIDKRFEIGPLAPEQVSDMAHRFFPDDLQLQRQAAARAVGALPRPAADWQVEFMDMARNGAGDDQTKVAVNGAR
jgi:chaperone BCS1